MANSANCIFCPSIYLCVVVKELAGTDRRTTRFGGMEPENRNIKYEVVGVTGFEPVTLRLSSACSNQLSYTPDEIFWWS